MKRQDAQVLEGGREGGRKRHRGDGRFVYRLPPHGAGSRGLKGDWDSLADLLRAR